MNSTEKMQLQENEDGTAIVTFDEEDPNGSGEAGANGDGAGGGADGDPGDGDDRGGDHAGGDDGDGDGGQQQQFRRDEVVTDADRERLRQKRRDERHQRKVSQREKLSQLDRSRSENALLRRQNEELFMRLSQVEKSVNASDISRIDKALEDAQLRLAYAESKIKEATVAADGDAMVKAQDMLFSQRREIERLTAVKQQAMQRTKPAAEVALPNPAVQRMVAAWMAKNTWYDPNLRDVDSKIAQIIDQQLSAEGMDAATQDYWDEFEERCRERLPHRYDSEHNSGTTSTTRRRPPPNMVSGTGRDANSNGSSRPGEIRLSRERVQAMKDSGAWDNPKRRAEMIKRYAAFDREANRRGGQQ